MPRDRKGPRPIIVDNSVTDHPVDFLYAWVAVDAETGNEGIIAGIFPGIGSAPLVTSERRLAERMRFQAQTVADETGRDACLVEFRRSGVLVTISGAS